MDTGSKLAMFFLNGGTIDYKAVVLKLAETNLPLLEQLVCGESDNVPEGDTVDDIGRTPSWVRNTRSYGCQ